MSWYVSRANGVHPVARRPAAAWPVPGGPSLGDHDQSDHDRRDRHQHVDQTLERLRRPRPSRPPGRDPAPLHRAQRQRDHREPERQAGPGREPGDHVETELVGPQRMCRGRAREPVRQVGADHVQRHTATTSSDARDDGRRRHGDAPRPRRASRAAPSTGSSASCRTSAATRASAATATTTSSPDWMTGRSCPTTAS